MSTDASTNESHDGKHQLLKNINVLDFTRVLAGPHCTRMMADLGARVIKVERPNEGDEMRRAPLQLPGIGDQSTYFARRNAGKESIAIDLSVPAGRALILDLARHIDVAVENFVPGVAAKLGIDHNSLVAVRPDIISCSISGYGQTGPEANQGAFAHVVSAASGIMHLDADDGGPRSSHLQAADVLAGTNAFGAIVAALYRRFQTGEGAYIDVSMLESLIASEDIAFGAVPNGAASTPGPRPGMGISRVGDRYIAWQSGGAPMLWRRLTEAMGRPELQQDPDFATPEARRERWTELQAIVSTWLQSYDSREEALMALRKARIPCAPVLTPEEVITTPQLLARRTFGSVPHPGNGEVVVTASPYWIDEKPVPARGPAPYRIGEHTVSVLEDLLGYGSSEIKHLIEQNAIAIPEVS